MCINKLYEVIGLSFNCIVAQSGGPTAAINSSLAGVIQAAIQNEQVDKIYGALNGIQGVLKENYVDLSKAFAEEGNIETLKHTPSMFLGSCRFKLDKDLASTQYQQIFNFFHEHDIKMFFYIGGNDSMDTVARLSTYAKENNEDVKVVGIPKTIDNDLYGTDHTPGFGSAAKFVASTLLDIAHDTYIYDIPSITIVEIMGRNAGWLTAASALARNTYNVSPDLIYLPEVAFSRLEFLTDLKELLTVKKNIIIAISEGIKDEDGRYLCESGSGSADSFGHMQLGGAGKALEHLVSTAINCKVRSVELNVLQRSAMRNASKTDLDEAFALGRNAVEFGLKGETGIMLTIQRDQDAPYASSISYANVQDIANQEKIIPREWINERGNNITEELVAYMRPLIAGEPELSFSDGLPVYMDIAHLTA